jgi:hypothetical protein
MKLRLLRLGGERQADKPECDPKCGQKRVSSRCLPRGSGRSKTKVAYDSCSGTSSLSGRPMSPLGHSRPMGHALTSRDVRNCSKAELSWCAASFRPRGRAVPVARYGHLSQRVTKLCQNDHRTFRPCDRVTVTSLTSSNY